MPSDGLAAEIIADDEDLQVQDHTDKVLRLVSAGETDTCFPDWFSRRRFAGR